jgi:hypothetical protein
MVLVRIGSGLGVVLLVALIGFSSLDLSLWKGLKATVDTRWGITTMVDLYLGLFVAAGWIAFRERSAWRSLLWLIGLCLLGNLTLLAYLLIASRRARTVEDLFRAVRRAIE